MIFEGYSIIFLLGDCIFVSMSDFLVVPGIIFGALSLYIGWSVLQSGGLGHEYFFLFSVGISLWLLSTVVELQVTRGALDTLMIQLHLIGIILTTFSLFLFAVRYSTGYSFSPLQVGAIGLIPLVNCVMIVLNPMMGLFWTDVSEITEYGLHFSKLEFGVFLMVHSVYSYLLVSGAALLFLWLMFKRRGVFTVQGAILLTAIVIPFGSSLLYIVGAFPDMIVIDPTPVLLTGTQMLFAFAFFRTGFYSVVPGVQMLGWSHISDIVDSGICITDRKGQIVEYNKEFEKLFIDECEGEPFQVKDFSVLDSEEEFVEYNRNFYSVRREKLDDNRGNVVGSVFTVTDVTELVESRQQVRVLNRFLRHNLRNTLSIVLLGVDRFKLIETQSDEDEKLIDENVELIKDNVNQLLSASQAAKDVEKSLSGESEIIDRNLETLVKTSIDDLTADLSDVSISCNVPSDMEVSVTDNFEIAISQMLKNAIDHSVEDEPLSIEVSADSVGDQYRLRIADDGPGMTDEAIESFRKELMSKEEDQLKHGIGLGFGIANWVATQSNGTFKIDDSVEDGSAVEFYLEKA